MAEFTSVRLFMLDLDGTFYLGDRLLPGAAAFIDLCRARNLPFLFLTNNSSKTAEEYVSKLAGFGIFVTKKEVLTSGDATLLYLAEHSWSNNLFVVGTESLKSQFAASGYSSDCPEPEGVVLGFDTALTFATLTRLCNAVRAGLPYLATHQDLNCPVYGGVIPDVGAVISFVKAATGRNPDVVIGKPNRGIVQAVVQRTGIPINQLCMVGDRLYTDMALGGWGVQTALVLCGETDVQQLEQSDFSPDFVFADLEEMGDFLARSPL